MHTLPLPWVVRAAYLFEMMGFLFVTWSSSVQLQTMNHGQADLKGGLILLASGSISDLCPAGAGYFLTQVP